MVPKTLQEIEAELMRCMVEAVAKDCCASDYARGYLMALHAVWYDAFNVDCLGYGKTPDLAYHIAAKRGARARVY